MRLFERYSTLRIGRKEPIDRACFAWPPCPPDIMPSPDTTTVAAATILVPTSNLQSTTPITVPALPHHSHKEQHPHTPTTNNHPRHQSHVTPLPLVRPSLHLRLHRSRQLTTSALPLKRLMNRLVVYLSPVREADPLLSLILSALIGHWPVRGSYQTE
ncbi:hypothetical protein J6590_073004 [Homalodisca vitripennis]|nr:hypothetical protein J6590_073004 [Homalodisca vitripennis]